MFPINVKLCKTKFGLLKYTVLTIYLV